MFHKLISTLLLVSPIYKYKINGNSMFPSLKDGDVVLVNRLGYFFNAPKSGDVVALRDPRDSKVLIKRILKIEEKKYFVVGDNKQSSTDSREFGMIGRSDIIGKVITP